MKKVTINIALAVALVLVAAISYVIGGLRADLQDGFAGTDSLATRHIEAANPDYVPWFQPLFQPSSSEVESGLFALQAALGGTVLGFTIGRLSARRRSAQPSDEA